MYPPFAGLPRPWVDLLVIAIMAANAAPIAVVRWVCETVWLVYAERFEYLDVE